LWELPAPAASAPAKEDLAVLPHQDDSDIGAKPVCIDEIGHGTFENRIEPIVPQAPVHNQPQRVATPGTWTCPPPQAASAAGKVAPFPLCAHSASGRMPESLLITSECHHVVGLDADADSLAYRMVVMAGHQRQQLHAAGQFQGVEELRSTKRA